MQALLYSSLVGYEDKHVEYGTAPEPGKPPERISRGKVTPKQTRAQTRAAEREQGRDPKEAKHSSFGDMTGQTRNLSIACVLAYNVYFGWYASQTWLECLHRVVGALHTGYLSTGIFQNPNLEAQNPILEAQRWRQEAPSGLSDASQALNL